MKQLQATSCHTLLYVYFTIKLNHVFLNVSSNGLAELMHSHIGYICLTFLHCVFSNESSNCLPERMRSHIGCICLNFLHCVFQMFSQVACLPVWLFSTVCFQMSLQIAKYERMHNHIGYICWTFLQYVFSNVSWNCFHKRIRNHTDCIGLTFLPCGFSNDFLKGLACEEA